MTTPIKQLVDDAWKRMNGQQHFDTIAARLDYAKSYYSAVIPKYSEKVSSHAQS